LASRAATILFVDESGYDAGESPYGVLAGISVEDRDLWSLVSDIQVAEFSLLSAVSDTPPPIESSKRILTPLRNC
jgi:hypothetical protein